MAFVPLSRPSTAVQHRSPLGVIRQRASVIVRAAVTTGVNVNELRNEEPKVVDMISSGDIKGKVSPSDNHPFESNISMLSWHELSIESVHTCSSAILNHCRTVMTVRSHAVQGVFCRCWRSATVCSVPATPDLRWVVANIIHSVCMKQWNQDLIHIEQMFNRA